MAAPLGNQFWKLASTYGRNPTFSAPEQLWDACEQYFAWNSANPLYDHQPVKTKEGVEIVAIPKLRAMTITGLCLFLNIDHDTWRSYCMKEEFLGVCTRAIDTIYKQKFEGAAANILNPSIIARDLGLVDKQEHKVDGDSLLPIGIDAQTDLARRIAFALAMGAAEGVEQARDVLEQVQPVIEGELAPPSTSG